jgi:L-threonylcarbamoyladenylate synthase
VKTEILRAESSDTIARAVQLLREGAAVALPTETVYGLAGDALKEGAVLKIFAAKDRPRFDPLIVHLPDPDWIERVAVVEDSAREILDRLRTRFWPGPLTFVLPRQALVSDLVTSGLDTVAIRISSHPIFRAVIRQFGAPLAAPSANRFGRISPTAAEHVREELDGLIPLIIDAGPTTHGIESTIVALRNRRIEILRRGPITVEQLSEFSEVFVGASGPRPEAPGQLPSHYAPRTPLMLVEDLASFVLPAGQRCGFLQLRTLSEHEDLAEAAANLFRCLRELDQQNLDLIVAEKFPDKGLGAAINDRLQRAAQLYP